MHRVFLEWVGGRKTQLGLVVVAAVTASILLAVAWSINLRTTAAETMVVRGQGQVFLHQIHTSLREVNLDPRALDEMGLLQRFTDSGLRYFAVYSPQGDLIYAAGESEAGPGPPTEEGLSDAAERVRLVQGPVAGDVPPGPPPLIVVEFESTEANTLHAYAQWALWAAIVGGGLLIGASILLGRQVKVRRAADQRLAERRMQANLGDMSATLAHELRNPLASLKGHAQLLEALLAAGTRERAKAQKVVTEVIRLEDRMNGLLDVVRSGRIEPVYCDVAGLLESARRAFKAEADVTVDASRGPTVWSLDPKRIGQVLQNLLQNAVQASEDETARIVVTAAEKRGKLCVCVRDHGKGLPEEILERLFDPFVTRSVRGTGLGLAISRQIVQAHGGEIEARNHPDGGAEFCFSLGAT